jgi:Ser/Thr protein kinase RdoA (MazF antagonist)
MTADPFLVLMTPAPCISEARAAAILSESFGIEGQLEALASERDTNFHVSSGNDEYVLKIANSAEDAGVTEFQNRALLHIAQVNPECPVPRVVNARNGDQMISISGDDGRVHKARVLSWLQGTQPRHAKAGTSVARPLGLALAQLGLALEGFKHESSDYSLLWDLKNGARLRQLLRHMDDPGIHPICTGVLDRFETEIEPVLPGLRWQVIHNDLNPGNALVDPESPERVTGIIDFGDMVYSPLIVDVAVACAYLVKEDVDGDALNDVESFLQAYTGLRPLKEDEVDVLYGLIVLRKVMTVLISNWRAAMYPENREYILRNADSARESLRDMHDRPSGSVTERLKQACQLS